MPKKPHKSPREIRDDRTRPWTVPPLLRLYRKMDKALMSSGLNVPEFAKDEGLSKEHVYKLLRMFRHWARTTGQKFDWHRQTSDRRVRYWYPKDVRPMFTCNLAYTRDQSWKPKLRPEELLDDDGPPSKRTKPKAAEETAKAERKPSKIKGSIVGAAKR